MDELKTFVSAFCISSVISAIAMFIVPDGAFKKIFSYITSLLLLLLIIKGVFNVESDIKLQYSDINNYFSEKEEYSEMIDEYICSNGVFVTEQNIRTVLDPFMTADYKVSINIKKNNNNMYCLDKITLIISKTDRLKTSLIIKKVGELTGITPEVIIYE